MCAEYVYDSATDYRARYYDPSIGRFISEDPIMFDGGVDFYAYVENHPIDAKDPAGLEPDPPLIPSLGPFYECFKKCNAKENHGVFQWLGLGAVVGGAPVIPKPFAAGGSAGTSPLSSALSRLLPWRLSWRWRFPAPTATAIGAETRVVGRVLGRWLPIIGMLSVEDRSSFNQCMDDCTKKNRCEKEGPK